MKIQTGSQQPTIAQQNIDTKSRRTESGAARPKTSKPLQKPDTTQFSAALDTELKSRQAEQAKRVESIKSLVKAGKYQVGSREVAEKMLSGLSETSSKK
jgi:flagellar biosynthesis anti-sigma factor FlgM